MARVITFHPTFLFGKHYMGAWRNCAISQSIKIYKFRIGIAYFFTRCITFAQRNLDIMKKIFILALALSMSMTNDCRAQKIDFRLFDKTALSDSTRLNYIVINREGKSAKDLYSDYLSVVNSIATSANSVQVDDGKSITLFNHCSCYAFYEGSDYYYTFDYRLQFMFKDGKVKVCAPWLDASSVRAFSDGIIKDSYRPDISDALRSGVNAFSGYFNKLITDIIQKADKVNEW